MSDSMRFFEEIYGESQGYISIVTFGETGEPDTQRWLHWPSESDFIERYVFTLRDGEDVYTPVNLFTDRERTKNDTGAITRVVGVDADTCDPGNFRIPPSAIVSTSEGRWHCWWFLDEEVPALEGSLAAQRIAKAHEDQGCDKPGTHSVSKILRIPGTTNTKYGKSETVTVEYTGERYTLDTINAVYADIALGSASARQEATTTADFDPDLFDDDQIERLHEYARVAWEQDEATLETHMVDGSWHTTAYKVACNMFRNANVQWSPYTHEQAETIITAAAKVDSTTSQHDLDRVFRDAHAEVGSDSLAMPAWALDLLPDLPPEPLPKADLPALEEVIKAAGMTNLYVSGLAENETNVARTIMVAKSLFGKGLNARQVFTLVLNMSVNKYKNLRPAKAIWADVQWALESLDTPEPSADPSQDIVFLNDTEREYLQRNPSFVDRYVAWVSSRTDAARVYSESFAWLILSAVYASRGRIPWNWETTPLNLWLLVLGNTTTSRKSTAKKHFIRMVRAFEQQTGELIDIGSDSTSEGLTKSLGTRDKMTSLLHIDEVNGFFKTAFTKNYQAGVIEKYTELYDGDVPVSLRATEGSGNAERATTQFMLVGVGIRAKTAEILTKSDFESGFLARMLWAVDHSGDKAPVEDRFKFRSGNIVRDDDMYELVDELVDRAEDLDPNEPRFILADETALARLNAWSLITDGMVTNFGDPEILMASVTRLQVSVSKAAALLAIHEGFEEVQLRHLLFALRQAESWFRDMVRMAREVSSSEYERRVDKVEEFIMAGKDGIRTDAAIRKQFGFLRPQEVDETLTQLTKSARIRKAPENAKAWQALV